MDSEFRGDRPASAGPLQERTQIRYQVIQRRIVPAGPIEIHGREEIEADVHRITEHNIARGGPESTPWRVIQEAPWSTSGLAESSRSECLAPSPYPAEPDDPVAIPAWPVPGAAPEAACYLSRLSWFTPRRIPHASGEHA
jgi:hypothetical protein